jgi:hypothetical protein
MVVPNMLQNQQKPRPGLLLALMLPETKAAANDIGIMNADNTS